MYKVQWVILFILAIILIVGIIAFVIYQNKKKWKCTEKSCERVIGGDYDTREKCLQKCSEKKVVKQVTFSEPLVKPNPNYACTSDYRCIEAENGDFSNLQACRSNCKQPQPSTSYYPVYYPAYYPQSLSYYPRRRFYGSRFRRRR